MIIWSPHTEWEQPHKQSKGKLVHLQHQRVYINSEEKTISQQPKRTEITSSHTTELSLIFPEFICRKCSKNKVTAKEREHSTNVLWIPFRIRCILQKDQTQKRGRESGLKNHDTWDLQRNLTEWLKHAKIIMIVMC